MAGVRNEIAAAELAVSIFKMATVLRASSRLFCNSSRLLQNSLSRKIKNNFSTSSKALVAGINDDLFALTEDQKDFRQTVHDFCAKELAPYADQIDKDNGWSEMR